MSETHERRESVRFAGNVNAGDTETETMQVPEDCTVERVDVRFYQGPRLSLHVVPFVQSDGDRAQRLPLVNFAGKEFVDGDNDLWTFETTESVESGQRVGVEVENTGDHAYDYAVVITVDYAGGTERAAVSLVERVAGWFA